MNENKMLPKSVVRNLNFLECARLDLEVERDTIPFSPRAVAFHEAQIAKYKAAINDVMGEGFLKGLEKTK